MKSDNSSKNTNIEILRLLCMYCIIIHHAVLYSDILYRGGMLFNQCLANILYIGGKLGANCFMAISAYYLVGKKLKIKRITSIWKVTFFYGVVFFILNYIMNFRDYQIRDLFETLFPITYKSYWYVTAYVGILMISPILNYAIDQFSEKQYRWILVSLVTMVSIPVTFFPKANPFSDESHLLLFVLIFLIMGYYKKYGKKSINYKLLFVLSMLWMIISAVFIVLIADIFNNEGILKYATFWMKGESLPMIFAAISLTVVFIEKSIVNNKKINSIAEGSFDIYLIHMNHFVYLWLWNTLAPIKNYYTTNSFIFRLFGSTLSIFIITLVIGKIRCIFFDFLEKKICLKNLNILEKITFY